MKVCTDACLFGAWTAAHSSRLIARSLLYIGTGTGLLSLMLAQKSPDIIVDAVEIDKAAAEQAKENFEASPWKERLHVHNTSIQQFANSAIHKYDLLISNPPFYESDLKSDNVKRNLALHSSELKLDELISIADYLLDADGSFFLLLPYHRTKDIGALIEKKFFVQEKILVKQTEKHGWFRGIWLLKKQEVIAKQSQIIITRDRHYSNEFINLLKEYYLDL